MKRILCIWLFVPVISFAQKKNFTYDQLFNGYFPEVIKQVPQVINWADDDHYLELIKDAQGKDVMMSVEAVSGKSVRYDKQEITISGIKGAINIELSPDKKFAAYTKADNNLYISELANNNETALTHDGSAVILNGYASWLYCEEILGRATAYKAFWWSPDSKRIVFMHFNDAVVPEFPIYVADGQHGYLEKYHYPKPGDTNPQVKIGIVTIAGGHTTWADFDSENDQYFGTPVWAPSNELLVQWMNRGQDELIVYSINLSTGTKKQIYKEHQPKYIQLKDDNRFNFLSAGKGFIFKSDKDGWDNLHLYDMNGQLISQVTKGNFWETSVLHIDEKNKLVYLRARKENTARFDIYKVSFDGKTVTRLSAGNFCYDNVMASPGGKYFIATYSNLQSVPVMALINNTGKQVREIWNSKGKEFNNYFIPQKKLLTVRSADGAFYLPMIITYPLNYDSTKKYPIWISVYGGPNSGKVFDRWVPVGGTAQLFAQDGLIQVSIDNRSSGHFGRKGMDYIFKQMGKYEIEDYMDCAKWILSQPWADSTRIGITGGSFGGYMTCMALTYGADVFTHGLALYSVTDWRLYDSHYTERFMKTPAENPEGYKQTSVMHYAEKYKGVLRIVHGSTDDNVHLQNITQLVDTLQNLDKSFELMIYSNQRHGIRPPKAMHNLNETIKFVNRYMLNK